MASGAEAIGAVNGVATLFNTAITWFDYVYVANNAWVKLQTLFLQLDNAQLRLTRWGEAAGLSGHNIYDEESKMATGSFTLDDEQEAYAIKTFTVICNNFKKCQKICLGFRKGKSEDDPSIQKLEVRPLAAQWLPMNRYLHDTMQRIVQGRKNNISIPRRLKFAIYDKSHLQDLVNDIHASLDMLYKEIPLPSEKQEELGKREVAEILKELQTFGDVVKRDNLLGPAIKGIVNQENNLSFHYKNTDTNVVLQGQSTGSTNTQHNYKGIKPDGIGSG